MFGIKKIDIYIIRSFLIYFFMTFFICALILLMQFTWKNITDLIGKGIGMDVVFEFFGYATLEVTPLALPLSILLAALMTFGNLGEHFELTAMKSAGISLFRIMRGLIVFIVLISISAFFFSNNVLPISKNKLWTLIFSLREKSPEFDIPEGEFYNGIGGYNIYVQKKDSKQGLLKNIMIYDFTRGFEGANITLADAGKVQFTADNKYIKLTLYKGESFEDLSTEDNPNRTNIPYRRENFETKKVLINFNSDFNRLDESLLKNEYVSKNVMELSHSIDSFTNIIVQKEREQSKELIEKQPLSSSYFVYDKDTLSIQKAKIIAKEGKKNYNPDSLFHSFSKEEMKQVAIYAKQDAKGMKDKVVFNKAMLEDTVYRQRQHQVEWHRKFTLSIACLIFFLIGAPLGAIVRKGGLGFPVVISVALFIVYYVVDTTGYKMAREGIWEVYQGMWLSSVVLFPLGVLLTWTAVVDASIFRIESYKKIFEQIKKQLNIKTKIKQ